jgi:chromosome partitioning protein
MSAVVELPGINRSVNIDGMRERSAQLKALMGEIRESTLAPEPRKNPPTFTSSQVAEMCGIDRARLHYLATKDGTTLPAGELQANGRGRRFTLAETRQWIQQVSPIVKSPLLKLGVAIGKVLATSNFKGGSSKTTTSMCMAQALSLRGRKVLLIDLDPQASLTELCGIFAETELTMLDTVYPYIEQPENYKLEDVIRQTYWDGIDLIPGHPGLFETEMLLSGLTISDDQFKFWAQLRKGLEPLKDKYDYIILDSAPSLSYLTINGLMAADAMVMPLVPDSLDFMSLATFWNLFSDLASAFQAQGEDKEYDFISILLSKVDNGPTSAAPVVRSWVQRAYGDWKSEIEIPLSSAMSAGALGLATVFDMEKSKDNAKTLGRVRTPYEDYSKWLDTFYVEKWEEA